MSIRRLLAIATLAAAATLPAAGAEAWTLTPLYDFQGGTDGSAPNAGLLYLNGTLYGTTPLGGTGACGCGTVFAVNATTAAETVLHSFQGSAHASHDGASPVAGLIQHSGILYGTTASGGASGFGTVFRLNPVTGKETVLYSFAGGTDGRGPAAGLTYQGGALYGTTIEGGTSDLGTVFKVDPAIGAESVLHNFQGGPNDGLFPRAALIYHLGFFYGTTAGGGASNSGTVFSLDATTGTETVLHSFAGGLHDGAAPTAGVVYRLGRLYGTTQNGGAAGKGTVFRVDATTGAEKVVHSFTGHHTDGRSPEAGLIYVGGLFYGTTNQGGHSDLGTIFQLDPATGAETVLYGFTGGADGAGSIGGLIYQGGAFYGTAAAGGSKACNGGCGTVFKLTP